jgi:PAS domain S-box-containing protein
MSSTTVGAAPFVEEALRWLPDATSSITVEEGFSGNELIPVPCPPLAQDDASLPKRPRVLVADDNADMRQYLVRLLAERYQVEAAPDGLAALVSIRERLPDLVLTDVMMPNLDGFGLLHELRADPATRTIPIILLSARAGEESRVEGMEHGADDYLIKPFSARELLARVHTHLEMARVRKQAEDNLRQRTAQFEALVDSAPLGVYLVDADLKLLHINPPAIDVFGDIPDLIGRDLVEVIHTLWPKSYADEIIEQFRHTLETGEPYIVPERIENRADRGVPEIYEWQINRIPLPDGRFGVVCYFRDISRLVHAREAVLGSQERLKLATEAAELGIWHWYLNEDQVSWENDRPYEIFDRAPEDGPINATEFRERYVHPEDLPAFENAISEMLQTRSPLFFQCRIKRRDGTVVWIELTGRLQRRADDSPWRILGTVLDITQRKQAEELLRRNRERFDLVAKAAQVGFWFCDLPFDKLMWDNVVKEHFWLPADAEVTIQMFYERLHPDDRERTRQAIADSNAHDVPYNIEYRTVSPDGREKWVRALGRTFYDSAGEPKRFDGLTLDITERKQAELALLESEERLRNLSGKLEAQVNARTSELQQRNADIVRQSEQVKDLSWRLLRTQDDERRHIARELHDSAGQTLTVLGMRLGELVAEAKQTSPKIAKDAEETQQLVQHLNQEIRTTSYLLHPPLLDETGLSAALDLYVRGLAERSGLTIQLNISESFGRLPSALELALFRMIQECLTNIHRHSESKVAVIRVVRDSDCISVDVQDRGKGMSAEKLAEIQARGSGVGIRGIQERLRQFDGQIEIESDDSGTRIHVSIPVPKSVKSGDSAGIESPLSCDSD